MYEGTPIATSGAVVEVTGFGPDLKVTVDFDSVGRKKLLVRYAGLEKDDQRVVAATDWIRKNYTLTENPGVGQQGLFYYFHTFGKTMSVIADGKFVDAEGAEHDWREELTARIESLQKQNGSWLNPQDRWYEGDPNLVTAYSLLALSYCE